MKILVTGGAGYIGSHTVYALIESGHNVVVVDNLVTGHRLDVHPDATFYEGNIGDIHFMVNVFKEERVDGVIHFAAYSLVGESMTKPHKYYENNVSATNNLLAAMSECGVKHLVFSSTAAVYGAVKDFPILESAPTVLTSTYGETKLAMERMIAWHGQATGMTHVALRYFNVAGAHPSGAIGEKHDPETHLIPLVLEVAKGTRASISVFGTDYETADGTCIRDYIHVCDLAVAHILAMEYLVQGGANTVCNLGNGAGFSVREVIETVRAVTECEIPEILEARRAGDPATLIASSERAKTVLGWEPRYPNLSDIVRSAWLVK